MRRSAASRRTNRVVTRSRAATSGQGTRAGAGGGAVGGEALAGPVPRREDAAAADAEGGLLVDLGFAVAGAQLAVGVLGLDAVEQPVRAAVRARRDPKFAPESVEV